MVDLGGSGSSNSEEGILGLITRSPFSPSSSSSTVHSSGGSSSYCGSFSCNFRSKKTDYKSLSLIALVFVNVLLVFSVSISRSPDIHQDSFGRIRRRHLYLTSTAVVVSELFKLLGSLYIEYYLKHGENCAEFGMIRVFCGEVFNEMIHKDMLKIGVPGILYVIENNLLFIALSNLSVAVYEVTDQFKILTTAVFSVYLLNMRLSIIQKTSLFMLATGVGIVELASSHGSHKEDASRNQGVGLCALLAACCISGYAGVTFEKVIKHGRPVSIFIRNVQLALFGVVFGIVAVYFTDEAAIDKDGFFQGYTTTTWIVVIVQAVVGVINALVIKYADNILKGFAASVATILASAISAVLFKLPMNREFVFGVSMVVLSVYLYGTYPAASEQGKRSIVLKDSTKKRDREQIGPSNKVSNHEEPV
uniref:Sugar phosphate transporter domain-containing protein n=1 Tax=Aplanochytrium stocchinoi TaxID=215587 RepID=A0A7S3V1K1_9STRA|mmetsp:Transcript_7231/g.9155  ORF Transcript_7231/g.9155 Transcript_7231/m.9155 type:complete len:420 (+) Transcript_7231:510-1769(+)|eukprot:CAMPEP_0204830216 /NCGR_PEP_ID=MMETSP1346-20131115/8400_1 /ASSEMBLY_ACC=CAM_ASM_000771 /TAXON_ID=215587 /ORGANISM="Aplanochytrium stocchinoi, Strain GSBS06" /LENGTH=419 /DNA_ID=CAMNT_0051960371 /DNA_START=590 /DNA_END=1849 /DNA_ORIENTATION=-